MNNPKKYLNKIRKEFEGSSGWNWIWSKLAGKEYDLIGDFGSWEEAVQARTDYDSEIILKKTKVALLKVKNGEAVYERDSVLFNEIQYSWPLLAGLMWVAAQSGGKLNVLDFGGSLGSTYFQNLAFLRSLSEVRWNIVEQPRHVEMGKKWFENDKIIFYQSIEECLAQTSPNIIILSSVLQYLKNPYNVLSKLLGINCNATIIDRTPFWNREYDRLSIQQVDPRIYKASYPFWIFSLDKFRNMIGESKIIEEYESVEKGLYGLIWKGFIIKGTR
jgi:putative methyltransferase (TIGR04325 family)